MLVVPQSTVTADLSLSYAPPPGLTDTDIDTDTAVRNATAATRRVLHDVMPQHRASWTFAQLPSMLRRRVLEYFNPGSIPMSTERPKPLCPLPGTVSDTQNISSHKTSLNHADKHLECLKCHLYN